MTMTDPDLPLQPRGTGDAASPWGISRMRPYPSVDIEPYSIAGVDPRTQTGIYTDANGQIVAMPKHGSNTGRETNQVSTHLDGTNDTDHDQSNDRD